MKAVRELNKEMPYLLKRGRLEQRDILFLFGKVREILENEGKYKSQFPQLNLFCNWCFHSKLSASKTIYNYLLKLSTSISKESQVKDGEDSRENTRRFISIGTNILNIPELRKGLTTVLKDHHIDTTISTNKKWWEACLQILLNEISEKPLEFPQNVINGSKKNKSAFKIYEKILQLPNSLNHDKIIRLEVRIDEKEKKYKIDLTALSKVVFSLELHGQENDSAFLTL